MQSILVGGREIFPNPHISFIGKRYFRQKRLRATFWVKRGRWVCERAKSSGPSWGKGSCRVVDKLHERLTLGYRGIGTLVVILPVVCVRGEYTELGTVLGRLRVTIGSSARWRRRKGSGDVTVGQPVACAIGLSYLVHTGNSGREVGTWGPDQR